MQLAKTLIRLGGCPDWSDFSLDAQSFGCFVMRRLIYRFWLTDLVQILKFTADWQEHKNGMLAQRRLWSDLPSLIRVFAVRMKRAWVLTYQLSAQRRLWSEWADARTDTSLRWAYMANIEIHSKLAKNIKMVRQNQTHLTMHQGWIPQSCQCKYALSFNFYS